MIRTALRLTLPLCMLPALAQACDPETGERVQRATLMWNGAAVSEWSVAGASMHRVDLPNGVALGLEIAPADEAKYASLRGATRYVPELVKIVLFDLSGDTPREFTRTWGGANSIQGYGASGGADRVEALGDPGVLLILHKPLCATATPVAGTPVPAATPAAPATPATPAQPATPAMPAQTPDDRFGLRDAPKDNVDEVRSEVAPGFAGWGPGSRIRLANGQVWQVIDGSAATIGKGVGPGVRVVRGMFGTFYMEFDGMNKAPKVKRVE